MRRGMLSFGKAGRRSAARDPARLPPHACWTCGYALEGLDEAVCPECATPTAWSRHNYALPHMPDGPRRRALVAAYCLSWGAILVLTAFVLILGATLWPGDSALRLAFYVGGAMMTLSLVGVTVGLWLCRWLWADAPNGVKTPIDSRPGAAGFAVAASVLVLQDPIRDHAPNAARYALLSAAVAGVLLAGWTMLSAVHFAERRRDPSLKRRTMLGWWLFVVGVVWLVVSVNDSTLEDTLPGWLTTCLNLIGIGAMFMPLVLASRAGELVKTLRRGVAA